MSNKPKVPTNETVRCNKCGLCLSICPVYGQERQESLSPRAKVQLIKHYAEQDLESSSELRQIVSQCLMCGSCSAGCPSGVNHASLFQHMRSAMVEDFGQGWQKKALYHFLTHEQQMELAARFAHMGQRAALDKLFRDFKLGNIPIKSMPRFNDRPFRETMPAVIEPRGERCGTVLYFTGCATNYVFGDIGRDVVKVLTRMGYRVEIPAGQVCCGLPMALQGSSAMARKNILKNIDLFGRNDVMAVITDCATCGSAFGSEYVPILKELGEDTSRAETLAAKVKDISLFLWENRSELEPHFAAKDNLLKVTYHAPCHLRNHQGVLGEVERLLAILPGVEYLRTPDFDACCGGGGTFFYDHPEISKQIVDRKVSNARDSGADLWLTGCPGCQINLAGNLKDDDLLQVLHPVQIVAAVLDP